MEKYIFIDCDGTLVPYVGSIPETALKALSQAKINGYKLVLCTGRFLDELDEEILSIGFDGLILNSGSYIQYHGKEIYSGSFPAPKEKEIIDYLKLEGLAYRLETVDDIYQSVTFSSYFDDFDQDDDSYKTINDDNCYRSDVVSITVAVNNDSYLKLTDRFPEFNVYGYQNNGIYSLALIQQRGLNKGTAIQFLSDFLHIQKEDTISIGDDYNDISMFENTAISICMKSGNELAKKKATYITDSPANDGIEKALRKLHII